jgi:hypothetical protein
VDVNDDLPWAEEIREEEVPMQWMKWNTTAMDPEARRQVAELHQQLKATVTVDQLNAVLEDVDALRKQVADTTGLVSKQELKDEHQKLYKFGQKRVAELMALVEQVKGDGSTLTAGLRDRIDQLVTDVRAVRENAANVNGHRMLEEKAHALDQRVARLEQTPTVGLSGVNQRLDDAEKKLREWDRIYASRSPCLQSPDGQQLARRLEDAEKAVAEWGRLSKTLGWTSENAAKFEQLADQVKQLWDRATRPQPVEERASRALGLALETSEIVKKHVDDVSRLYGLHNKACSNFEPLFSRMERLEKAAAAATDHHARLCHTLAEKVNAVEQGEAKKHSPWPEQVAAIERRLQQLEAQNADLRRQLAGVNEDRALALQSWQNVVSRLMRLEAAGKNAATAGVLRLCNLNTFAGLSWKDMASRLKSAAAEERVLIFDNDMVCRLMPVTSPGVDPTPTAGPANTTSEAGVRDGENDPAGRKAKKQADGDLPF